MTISRKSLWWMAALLGLLLIWRLWPSPARNLINLPPSAAGPWIAFGDSLTEGYGGSSGGYPTYLSQRLGFPIENHGRAGETSGDGMKRLPEIEALNPRVVLLCFGGNDMLQALPREQMFANLRAMVERLQARGSFVVLLGIRSASLLQDHNAKDFAELAADTGAAHLPDLLDGIMGKPSLMSDYVHPNDAGYEQIASRIEKALQPHLTVLQSSRPDPSNK